MGDSACDHTLVLQKGSFTLQTYAGDVIKEASEVTVTLISQTIVGVDVQAKVKPMSDYLDPSLARETSPGEVRTETSKLQPQGGAKPKQKEPTKVSKLHEKYSFQPVRSKKLLSDKTEKESSSEVKNASQQNSKTECYATGAKTKRHIPGKHETMKPNEFRRVEGDLSCDVIDMPSSASSGRSSIKRTSNDEKRVGISPRPKGPHEEVKSRLQTRQENLGREKLEYSTSQITQRPADKILIEPAKSKEDLGFDIDELFHSSSFENLDEGDDAQGQSSKGEDKGVSSPLLTSKQNREQAVPKTGLLNEPPPVSYSKDQQLDLPLTHFIANYENSGEVLKNFNASDLHSSCLSQEDDLNELFLEMSSEDVGSGDSAVKFSPPKNSNFCGQLAISDSRSDGFKFDEIPRKLRTGYSELPTNSERFEWESPELEIDQVSREFIAPKSTVSPGFTAQFGISSQMTFSKPVENVRRSFSDSSSAGTSEDLRSLERAVRAESFSASRQRSEASYRGHPLSNCDLGPFAAPTQNTLPFAAPTQNTLPFAAPTQNTLPFAAPVHAPPHIEFPVYRQSYPSQIEFPHFSNLSHSPLHDYRIPVPQLTSDRRSRLASSLSTPRSRISREVGSQASATRHSSRNINEPMKEALEEVLQNSGGLSQLPPPPAPKRRRTTSADAYESDSGVGRSVCTNLSSLMAIHGGYSKSLSRNDL
ncbi:hypothetical protein GE061_018566 [Apolygus lucorum]|uniref:Uncharacterized protein n=1 Tax=Apolygus lucorum TaxID=248454 RepID=A0A8S9XIB4_APOLU|nr:hypothetical protein GE061_018566 [Apolygus lucorum]